MDYTSQEEAVFEVVERLIGTERFSKVGANETVLSIDISRPNIHDSKREFLNEQDTVSAVIKSLEEVVRRLAPEVEDTDQVDVVDNLGASLDRWAIRKQKRNLTTDIHELVMRNHIHSGFQANAIAVMARMAEGYRARLEELKDQEAEFWSVKNRPPNYYARTIALRVARLYAREKGKYPSYGTSADGGHASTDYSRALEEIFMILNIDAKVPNPASWAVSQLTAKDLYHPKNPKTAAPVMGRRIRRLTQTDATGDTTSKTAD